MNLSNKHIILLILAIIILTFVYNYDVYIVEKNKPICKPVYVTKKILTPEAEEILKDTQPVSEKYIEGFETIMSQNAENSSLVILGNSLSTFTVAGVTDKKKIKVIDSVVKVLSNIPTNLDVELIKQMIEYFGMIYQTSSNLANFYQNVSTSTKIKDYPYNSKYSQLVLFLIGKFTNDLEECIVDEIPKIKKVQTVQTVQKVPIQQISSHPQYLTNELQHNEPSIHKQVSSVGNPHNNSAMGRIQTLATETFIPTQSHESSMDYYSLLN